MVTTGVEPLGSNCMFIPTYLIWDFFKKNESKHLLFLWIVDENGAKILILTKRVFQLRPRKAIQEYIKWFNSKYIQLKPKCCLTAPSIQFGVLLRRLSPSVPSEASMLSCLSLLIRWRPKFYIPSTIKTKINILFLDKFFHTFFGKTNKELKFL